mgnify:CR=1 FL=1
MNESLSQLTKMLKEAGVSLKKQEEKEPLVVRPPDAIFDIQSLADRLSYKKEIVIEDPSTYIQEEAPVEAESTQEEIPEEVVAQASAMDEFKSLMSELNKAASEEVVEEQVVEEEIPEEVVEEETVVEEEILEEAPEEIVVEEEILEEAPEEIIVEEEIPEEVVTQVSAMDEFKSLMSELNKAASEEVVEEQVSAIDEFKLLMAELNNAVSEEIKVEENVEKEEDVEQEEIISEEDVEQEEIISEEDTEQEEIISEEIHQEDSEQASALDELKSLMSELSELAIGENVEQETTFEETLDKSSEVTQETTFEEDADQVSAIDEFKSLMSELSEATKEMETVSTMEEAESIQEEIVPSINRIQELAGKLTSEDSKDSLEPLDQKFVTLKEFNRRYSDFINKVQTQLSTLGGGGDDIKKWIDYAANFVTPPVLIDSIEQGDVYQYTYTKNMTLYRLVPNTNDLQDSFYRSYVNGVLSNIVVKRGM